MAHTNTWMDGLQYDEDYPVMMDLLQEPSDQFPIHYQTEWRLLPVRQRWWQKLLRRPVKYAMTPVQIPYMTYKTRNVEEVVKYAFATLATPDMEGKYQKNATITTTKMNIPQAREYEKQKIHICRWCTNEIAGWESDDITNSRLHVYCYHCGRWNWYRYWPGQ